MLRALRVFSTFFSFLESLPMEALVGVPSAEITGAYGEGVGPIFLSQLACTQMDSNILSCPREGTSFGITGCTHARDVGVSCPGW